MNNDDPPLNLAIPAVPVIPVDALAGGQPMPSSLEIPEEINTHPEILNELRNFVAEDVDTAPADKRSITAIIEQAPPQWHPNDNLSISCGNK